MDKKLKKAQSFTIFAKAEVTASIEIIAEDWDDALLKAKALNVPDFVTPVEGDVFDDWENFEITGMLK